MKLFSYSFEKCKNIFIKIRQKVYIGKNMWKSSIGMNIKYKIMIFIIGYSDKQDAIIVALQNISLGIYIA